jgi:hypothetical protein
MVLSSLSGWTKHEGLNTLGDMSKRAGVLASHLKAFHNRLMAFLDGLDEHKLSKVLAWEGYPVLTTAAHISGQRHYGLIGLADKIIRGEEISDITKQMAIELANQDFEYHLDWSLEQVVSALNQNGGKAIAYISSLNDTQLEKSSHIASYGGHITTDELIDWILIGTSVEHLENMKRTVL